MDELEQTVEQLDREIGRKRHQEMAERSDALISLVATLQTSVEDLKDTLKQTGSFVTQAVGEVLQDNTKNQSQRFDEAMSSLSNDIRGIKIEPQVTVNTPAVNIPEIRVPEFTIPEIKIPEINVPKPEVTVNVPKIEIPSIEIPKIEVPAVVMPDTMNVSGDVGLRDVDRARPLPVMLMGPDGNPQPQLSAIAGGHSGAIAKEVSLKVGGNAVTIADVGNLDAFGRLRISNPHTLFDSKNIFDDDGLAANVENQPLFYDNQQVSGAGTATAFNANEASQSLSVSANTAGKRVRQTYQRFNYQPGKSQLILLTFVLGTQTSGVTKREGIFDDNNGLFLEDNGSSYRFVRRTYVSGSAVDEAVPQTNWNIDPLNGTGKSKIRLDFTKTQILLIDFEWLGVGRVRFGFVVDGKIYYAHEMYHANVLTTVYMQTPNLPLRSEISNGGAGAAASIIQICSTVISEGGSQDLGVIRYASTAGTHVDADVENTIYAVLGVRLKTNYIGASVKFLNAALQIATASSKAEWILKLDPNVAGTFTYSNQSNSAVSIALGATANTVTGGVDITGGFVETGGVQTGAAGSAERGIDTALVLGSSVAGTTQSVVLCVRPIGGSANIDVEGALTWRELV